MSLINNNFFKLFALCALLISISSVSHAQTTAIETNQKPSSISNKKDPINKVKKQVKPAEPLATVLPGNFLTLRIKKYSKERPDVYFGRQQTIVFDDKTHWKIMLGISPDTVAGKYLITGVEKDKTNFTHAFLVLPQTAHIQDVANSEQSLLKRFSIRTKKKQQTKVRIPKNLPWSNLEPELPLTLPVDSGLLNFNPKTDSSIDPTIVRFTKPSIIQQKERTKSNKTTKPTQTRLVKAPSKAIVLKVQQDELGYKLWLDHGMGIFSHISGLDAVYVSEQDFLKRSSVIGFLNYQDADNKIESSIEWCLLMNKQFINPLIITEPAYNSDKGLIKLITKQQQNLKQKEPPKKE